MIDLSFLEKFTKGDKQKMKRYIQLYLKIAPETFRKMQQNISSKDWEQLRINAHSLKPQAEYMGISSLKAVLVLIENSVRDGKIDGLAKLYQKTQQLHNESKVLLRKFMEKI